MVNAHLEWSWSDHWWMQAGGWACIWLCLTTYLESDLWNIHPLFHPGMTAPREHLGSLLEEWHTHFHDVPVSFPQLDTNWGSKGRQNLNYRTAPIILAYGDFCEGIFLIVDYWGAGPVHCWWCHLWIGSQSNPLSIVFLWSLCLLLKHASMILTPVLAYPDDSPWCGKPFLLQDDFSHCFIIGTETECRDWNIYFSLPGFSNHVFFAQVWSFVVFFFFFLLLLKGEDLCLWDFLICSGAGLTGFKVKIRGKWLI